MQCRATAPLQEEFWACAVVGLSHLLKLAISSKWLAPAPRVLTRQRTDRQVGDLFLCDTGREVPPEAPEGPEGGPSPLAWL